MTRRVLTLAGQRRIAIDRNWQAREGGMLCRIRICDVDWCEAPHEARGYCRIHYRRFRDHGDPEGGSVYHNAKYSTKAHDRKTLERRFWRKVHFEPNSGCWLYSGGENGHGYCSIKLPHCGRRIYVHRLSYEMHKGAIPAGLEIDHRCRVRCCVNPDHLEAVTVTENRRRIPDGLRGARKKSHCKQGHPYAGENLYLTPRGYQVCRTCQRRSDKRFKARKAETRCLNVVP